MFIPCRSQISFRYSCLALFVLLAVVVIPETSSAACDFSDTLKVGVNKCGSRMPQDAVANENGLIYYFWMADPTDCADKKDLCGSIYLTVLDSGQDTLWMHLPISGGNGIRDRRVAASVASGALLDTIYVVWGERSDCHDESEEILYATMLFDKSAAEGENPLDVLGISSVTTANNKAHTPDVEVGIDDTLHFAWTDNRCFTSNNWGSIFYRMRDSAGWLSGESERVCESSWDDDASLVNMDCVNQESDSTCCPRSKTDCDDSYCSRVGSGPPILLKDGSGRLQLVWHDTDVCYRTALPWDPKTPDVVYHRTISAGGWGDITCVGQFQSWRFGACLLHQDTLVIVVHDKIGDASDADCGIWYRLKDSEEDFGEGVGDPDSVYLYSEGDTCVVRKTNEDMVGGASVAADDNGLLHFTFSKKEGHTYPDGVGDFSNTYHRSVARPPESQTVRSGFCNLSRIEKEGFRLVQDSAGGGCLVTDACGKVHAFYTHTYRGAESKVKAIYHRVIQGDACSDVLGPDGGEFWKSPSTHVISWKVSPGDDQRVGKQFIYLTADTGYTRTDTVAVGLHTLARAFEWDIESVECETYRIQVVSYLNEFVGEEWALVDSCVAMSEDDFEVYYGSTCPRLYVLEENGNRYVNTVLSSLSHRGMANDYILVENVLPDLVNKVRFVVKEDGEDTTYVFGAHITPLCSESGLVSSPDGALFRRRKASPPVGALAAGRDILHVIAERDGLVFEGRDGLSATITLPTLEREAVLLLEDVSCKPPIRRKDSRARGSREGVEVVIEDGASFVTNSGTTSTVTLPPRENPCDIALRMKSDGENVPVVLRIDWHGEYPLDRVALDEEPVKFVPDASSSNPVAVQCMSSNVVDSEQQYDFPYRLTPGDKLVLEFERQECAGAEPTSILIHLLGYYSGPSDQAGTPGAMPLSVSLTSTIPLSGPVLSGTFSVPRPSSVTLAVYDVRGRLMKQIAKGRFGGGIHGFEWDLVDKAGYRVSPGVYFARLEAGNEIRTCRIVLVR